MLRKLIPGLILASAEIMAAPAIVPKEAATKIQAGEAILIDVREESELAADGMAEPARWFPNSEAKAGNERFESFVKELPKNKTIILYCKSGARSGRIADELAKRGFTAANLGGLKDWQQAGYAVKKAPTPTK